MNKSLDLAVFVLATSLATSYGQGKISFSTYYCNDGAGAVTYLYGTHTYLDSSFTAELIWSPGTVADPVNYSDPSSITTFPSGSLSPATGSFKCAYTHFAIPGEFDGGVALLPGYTSGPVTFEILAYNATDYASATIRGRSGSFTMASVTTGSWPALFMAGVPNFFVAEVPEPSALGMLAFGGILLLGFGRWKTKAV